MVLIYNPPEMDDDKPDCSITTTIHTSSGTGVWQPVWVLVSALTLCTLPMTTYNWQAPAAPLLTPYNTDTATAPAHYHQSQLTSRLFQPLFEILPSDLSLCSCFAYNTETDTFYEVHQVRDWECLGGIYTVWVLTLHCMRYERPCRLVGGGDVI